MTGCVAVDGEDGSRVGFGGVVDGAADAFGCEEDGFGAESGWGMDMYRSVMWLLFFSLLFR